MLFLYRSLLFLVFTLSVNSINGEVAEDCPAECGFGNYYDDLTDYIDYFNKSVEYATERHKGRVSRVMDDLYAELQPSVELSEARLRQSGELVKSVTERILEEAPDYVQMCLQNAKERIEAALQGTAQYLKTCTDEMNKDSVAIMAAYDKEAEHYKKRVADAQDTLLACNKNVTSYQLSDVFRLHSQCCVFDMWNKTRGILHEFNQFTAEFFVHGTDKGKEYIVNSVVCLEEVGKRTYMKVKKITDGILNCAGLTAKYVYLD